MPKISLFLQEVVSIVATFLKTIKENQIAQKLQSQYPIPDWIQKKNPLLKKGLKKALKQYVNNDQTMLQYYTNRKQVSESKDAKKKKISSPAKTPIQSPKVVTKKQDKKPLGWMAKFEQPKRLEDLNEFAEIAIQEQVDVPKKQKKQQKKNKKSKKAKQLQSSQMESQQQFQLQKKQEKVKKQQKKKLKNKKKETSQSQQSQSEQVKVKAIKKTKIIQKKIIKQQLQAAKKEVIEKQKQKQKQNPKIVLVQNTKVVQAKNNQSVYNNQKASLNGYKNFFSRINKDQVGPIQDQLRDNSFYAKAKYGGGDVWGQYGYQKLKDTRGDSFKKTKGKLKNKAFQGSGIDINRINSIAIL